jgi:hypothetical protein
VSVACPSLLCIVYPETVKDAQARLLAAMLGTDQGVQACASLDNQTRAAWGDFFVRVTSFCKQEPGWFGLGTMMDQCDQYAAELAAWQKTTLQSAFAAAGCTQTTPAFDPNTIGPHVSDFVAIAQALAIAASAIAGAYVIGQVVAFIPKASAPSPSPRLSARTVRRRRAMAA